MFKIIILDFDGVILESLDIKTKAFLKVYEDYPEYAEKIAQYHLQNGGVSRYKKFVYINTNILGIPVNDAITEKLAMIFSEAVVDEMLKCPFVNGALDFINKYSNNSNLYIASGTPEDELVYIVEKYNLGKYFKGVYGTPRTKSEIIAYILNKEMADNEDAVFIGDAITDYNGAKEANVAFIARMNGQTPDNPFSDMDVVSVNDLRELDEVLEAGF
ncbi:HAD family hydrolase [Methanolobus psychrotolerans]|uniref:HAD family hydrolase n=1 Tax=Methanolobus psychrotolerans TaxID=1874706 RepID=UPI0013EA0F9B|nr:HAD-IA family hydrolase [Methanolobus psychrotolerans]